MVGHGDPAGVEQLDGVDGGRDGGPAIHQAGLTGQGVLQVAEPAALSQTGAVTGDGDAARDHEVDGLQLGHRQGPGVPAGALDGARLPGRFFDRFGVQQEERVVPGEPGDRHVDDLAVLQRALTDGPLGRVGVRLDRPGATPCVRPPEPLGRGLRAHEVRDPALGAREPAGAGVVECRPHLLPQRRLAGQQAGVPARVVVVPPGHGAS